MTVTERRNRIPHYPDDKHPVCEYCESMRWVIDPRGNLKRCPVCSGGPTFDPAATNTFNQ